MLASLTRSLPLELQYCINSTPELPVCQDGVRNWERREEAEGPGCGARDSSAEMRFMTEASWVALLAWWSPVSNRPERPGVGREKNRLERHQNIQSCLLLSQNTSPVSSELSAQAQLYLGMPGIELQTFLNKKHMLKF